MHPDPWHALAETVRIIHLDHDLVVVEKPAGLATVRYEGPDAPPRARRRHGDEPPVLTELVPLLIASGERGSARGRPPGGGGKGKPRARRGRMRPVRVVQRLDLGTSGLVVFARTIAAERALGTQFRRHRVRRSYLALVRGDWPAPRRIESLLVENRGDGLRGSHPSRGKRAVTHVRPLERFGTLTLVECRLETGRTHQIRIHLAEAGHPLSGEQVYNRPRFGAPGPDPSGAPRLMLHAGELGFRHPRTGQHLQFTTPPPKEFLAFLERLREPRRTGPPERPAPAPSREGTANGMRRKGMRRPAPRRGQRERAAWRGDPAR
jgi:23S rRNA pseudouridine1911/1915/1917 synthase